MKKFVVFALGILTIHCTSYAALIEDIEAFNNATVQPAGPRTGTSGKNYFNIEGSGNGTTYSSFGVMDFSFTAVSLGSDEIISSVNSISLTLTQSNISATLSGGLAFYLTTDTSTSIESGGGLAFNMSDAPGGLGSQLATNYFLGNYTFTEVSTGTVDNYQLDLSGIDPEAQTYLTNLLTIGGVMRLIVVATDTSVAATYAGYSNSSYAGPTVDVDYSVTTVPEPSTYALLAAAGLTFIVFRRSQRLAA